MIPNFEDGMYVGTCCRVGVKVGGPNEVLGPPNSYTFRNEARGKDTWILPRLI